MSSSWTSPARVLKGAHVWNGRDAFVSRELHMANGQFVAESDENAEELPYDGLWLVPGFIDAHFHAYSTSLDGIEDELTVLSYTAINATGRLSRALRRGFTTVRDVAGGDIGLARAIERELFPSPRYFYTGPALSQTGGHGDPRTPHVDTEFRCGHICEIADGVDELLRAVRNRFRTGAHAIKVMASGGVTSLSDPLGPAQYSAAELLTVVSEAERRGSYVCAHAYSNVAIQHAIKAGVRSIEHGNLLDEQTAQLMADRKAYLVPTLATYEAMARFGEGLGLSSLSLAKNQEILAAGQSAIRIAQDAGVEVGFGTDLMGDLEAHQLIGVELQVAAMGAAKAIISLTETNARLLRKSRLGNLNFGSHADVIAFDRNPLEFPEVLWTPESRKLIIQGGRIVHAAC